MNPFPIDNIQRNLTMCPAPTKEKVVRQLKQLRRIKKNNKAPRENNIFIELLKNSGNKLKEHIYLLIKEIWKKEIILEDWKSAIMYPMYKKDVQ